MALIRYIPLLILLHACGRANKNSYEINYAPVDFTLSVPDRYFVQEMYEGKNEEGVIYRRIDSTGITNITRDPGLTGKDTNAVDERKIMADPNYFFVMLKRMNYWDLNFSTVVSGKYQDTAVVYDKTRMQQKDFLESYVFGPGRDSSFYVGITVTEIEKDGKKLFKVVSLDGSNVTYTGMVGKYWFMLQFMAKGKDTIWVNKIWEQSRFAN